MRSARCAGTLKWARRKDVIIQASILHSETAQSVPFQDGASGRVVYAMFLENDIFGIS